MRVFSQTLDFVVWRGDTQCMSTMTTNPTRQAEFTADWLTTEVGRQVAPAVQDRKEQAR